MQREVILTADGSATIAIPEINATYHSKHGAIRESMHVFIETGLRHLPQQPAGNTIHLFEMGFGTGLNALLTLQEAMAAGQNIHYHAIELFPLPEEKIAALNYGEQLNMPSLFHQLHQCPWEEDVPINEHFTLYKTNQPLEQFTTTQLYDLVYYDAFAPGHQPELWTKEIFRSLYNQLQPNGILVTYCSKGEVRRAMQAAGLSVAKLPGPPGKREIVRATRP